MKIINTSDLNVIKVDDTTSVILSNSELKLLDNLFGTSIEDAKVFIKRNIKETREVQKHSQYERERKEAKKERMHKRPRAATEYNGPPEYVPNDTRLD